MFRNHKTSHLVKFKSKIIEIQTFFLNKFVVIKLQLLGSRTAVQNQNDGIPSRDSVIPHEEKIKNTKIKNYIHTHIHTYILRVSIYNLNC